MEKLPKFPKWIHGLLCNSQLSILLHGEFNMLRYTHNEKTSSDKSLVSGSASAAAAKSLQSCPTLRDPIDGSPPGSPIPGILQARTLEWVAISFSNA